MKVYKIIFTILAFVIVTSCGDKLADLNENPNSSLSAGSGEEVFTAATGYYGIALDAYFNETDAVLAQYWAGGPGVALIDVEKYFFEPLDFNQAWSFSYLQALSDLKYVIDNGNEALAGAANIYSVLIYQNLVDHYGDIPYFNALSGQIEQGGVLTPEYDNAKLIYDDLIVRLDASIATLSDPNLSSSIGAEDVIYNGDLDNWLALANSLKLRLLMRQSITDPSVGAQVIALIAEDNFIDDASKLAKIPFSGAASANMNPQYTRREVGIGQFYVLSNSTFNVMNDLNDPRLPVLFAPATATGLVAGLDQGGINEALTITDDSLSFPTSVQYAETNDVILMSHWEVMFLRSEADMRFGTADDETAMFNAAVSAHFNYIGMTTGQATAYLASDATYDASLSDLIKSNVIGQQKWISMIGLQEAEGWIESRRFDQAGSNLFTAAVGGVFNTPPNTSLGDGIYPSVYLYPQTEVSFNASNTPTSRSVTDKVFWDN